MSKRAKRVVRQAVGSVIEALEQRSMRTGTPAVAGDTFVLRNPDAAIRLDVLANDGTSAGPLTIVGITQPSSGMVQIESGSPNRLSYLPAAGFTGSVNFTYTAQDAGGDAATGTVNVQLFAGGLVGVAPGSLPGSKQFTTDDGFVVAADTPFLRTERGNFSFTTTLPSTTTTAPWADANGVAHTRTTTRSETISATSTEGTDGSWTYNESAVLSTTILTVPIVAGTGTTETEGVVDAYGLAASADNTHSGYTFTGNESDNVDGNSAGSVALHWHSSSPKSATITDSTDLTTGVSSGTSLQDGAYSYLSSSTGTYSYATQGGTVAGTNEQSSSVNDTYHYTSAGGSYVEQQSNGYSYSGNGNYADANSAGTINEGGSGSTSAGYTIASQLVGGAWVKTGSSSRHEASGGDLSSSGNGTYSRSTTTATDTSAVSGSTDVTHAAQWNTDSTTDQTLGTDGSWQTAGGGGDSSGSSSDDSSYTGSGTYSATAPDSNSSGNIDEGGSTSSSTAYSIHTAWAGGSWVSTGTNTAENSDHGHLSSSGAGSYTHVTATAGASSSVGGSTEASHSNEWDTSGGTTQTLGVDGNWTTSAGGVDSTGSSDDGWSSGGSGTYSDSTHNAGTLSGGGTGTYTDDDSSGGTITEDDNGSSSSSYSIHSGWSGGSWVKTGTNTSNNSDDGHRASSGTGTYTHVTGGVSGSSSVNGSTGTSQTNEWHTHGSVTTTLDSGGAWATTGGGGESSGAAQTDSSYGGSGSYSDANDSGSINEDGTTGSTSSYNTNWDWSGGTWVQTGTTNESSTDQGNWSSAGSGSYLHATSTATESSSVQGTSGATRTNNWDTQGNDTSTLGSDGSWTLASGSSDTTGASQDDYSYSGSGSYSSSSNSAGTLTSGASGSYSNTDSKDGSISEAGSTGTSSSYSIHSEWDGVTWADTGTSNDTSTDTGNSTSSGTGSYTHTTTGVNASSVSGTSGETQANEWDTHGSVTSTIGSDGSWATAGGDGDSTTSNTDDWSYSGSGSNSGSSTPGTVHEDGTNGATSSDSQHWTWDGGSWLNTGTDSATTADHGDWTSSGTGSYTHTTTGANGSSVSGTNEVSHTNEWDTHGSVTSTLGSDGSWSVTDDTGDSTGSTADGWSYGGSGSYSGSSTPGTITEDGNNQSTTGYSVHWGWTGTSISYQGQETAGTVDGGHWTSSGSGSYTHSTAVQTVHGTTGASHGTEWDNHGDVTSTLDSDGSWSVASGSGDSTGSTIDGSTYSGDGTYTDPTADGSIHEDGENQASTSYSIHSAWSPSDSSPTYTGTDSATTLDKGHWSSSGTGSYAHDSVTGSTDVSHSTEWDTHGSVTSTLGTDGSWSTSSGSGDSTATTDDDWSYDGSGSWSDGGNTGNTDESGSTGSTSTYSVHAAWSAGAWVKSGTKTDTSNDQGQLSSSGSGTYSHAIDGGSVAGATDATHSKDWSSDSTWTQEWDANSGTWTTAARTSSSTATQLDSDSSSGSGSYVHDVGGVPVSGTASESNDASTSLSYTTTGTLNASNEYSVSGTGTGDRGSHEMFSYSGDGSFSTSYTTADPYGAWYSTHTADGNASESGGRHHSLDVNTSWILDPNGHWRAKTSTGTEDGDTSGQYDFSNESTDTADAGGGYNWGNDSSTSGSESFNYSYHRDATATTNDDGSVAITGSGHGEGNSKGKWKVRARTHYAGGGYSYSTSSRTAQDNYDASSQWNASYTNGGIAGSATTTTNVDGSSETHNDPSYSPADDASSSYSEVLDHPGFYSGGGGGFSTFANNAPNLGYGGAPDTGAVGPAPDQLSYDIRNDHAPAKPAYAGQTPPAETTPADTSANPENDADLANIRDLEARKAYDASQGGANQDYFNGQIAAAKQAFLHKGDASALDYAKAIGVGALKGGLQGVANAANGVTDAVIGTANLGIKFSPIGAIAALSGTDLSIPASDWSNDLVTSEPDWQHNVSKFLGGQGIITLATAGVGALAETGAAAEEVDAAGEAATGTGGGGCFLAGTDVLLGDGTSEEQIQEVHVGQRVATDDGVANSTDGKTAAADPNATEVDPATWRLVTITAGDWRVQALAPEAWIVANGVTAGKSVRLSDFVDLAEMGVPDGLCGMVQSVTACPPIEAGPGRVVLATVSHLNDDVYDLTLRGADGRDDTIGVTGYHRVYTEDRGWVDADELAQGELVRTAKGDVVVASLLRDPGTFTVYNMTVEADHDYYVGDLDALVHNTCPTTLGESDVAVGIVKDGKIATQALYGEDPLLAPSHEALAKAAGLYAGPGELIPGAEAFTVMKEGGQIFIRGSNNFVPTVTAATEDLLRQLFI